MSSSQPNQYSGHLAERKNTLQCFTFIGKQVYLCNLQWDNSHICICYILDDAKSLLSQKHLIQIFRSHFGCNAYIHSYTLILKYFYHSTPNKSICSWTSSCFFSSLFGFLLRIDLCIPLLISVALAQVLVVDRAGQKTR